MPKALDAIFEKYEPQAKKIREAESGAARRALEASREPRFPAEATEAGVEPEMGYGYDSYGYGDYDYGYSPYYGGGYDSGYSPYYGGGYDAGYSPETSFDRGNGRRRNGGPREISPGGPRAEKAPSEEKEEKEKEKAEEFIPHVEITEIIGRIKNSLEQITATLTGEEYPQLKDLVTHVRDQEVNNDLANYILPTVINKNIIALSDNIKKIDELSKKLNSVTLSTYQSEIKKVFGKNRKELEKLSKDLTLFEPLTEAEKKRAAEAKKTGAEEEEQKEEEQVPQKVDITTLSPHKRWAYFADEDAKKELEEEGSDFTEKVVNPKSLRTIKKNIDNLFKEVKAYGERKAAPKKVEKKIEKPAE
jgi:hypothetical protein